MTFKIQTLVEWLIYAEFFLIIVLLIITYAMGFYYYIKKKISNKIENNIKTAFANMMETGQIDLSAYYYHTHILIDSFIDWDKQHKGLDNWEQNKTQIVKTAILPRAVRYIRSHDWTKRFWLLECLGYYIDSNYETMLIKLINDKFSVVSISATSIAMKLPSAPVLHALFNIICNAHGQFQSLYIAQLRPTPILYDLIKEKLDKTTDHHIRHTCYKILQQIGVHADAYDPAIQDLSSTDQELKLAAIRILPQANADAATPILLSLLHDPDWLVRNTAIHAMEKLNKQDIIEAVAEAVYDPVWWVRVNAAKLLATFGQEGQIILQQYVHYKDLTNVQEPAYFLKIHDMREE